MTRSANRLPFEQSGERSVLRARISPMTPNTPSSTPSSASTWSPFERVNAEGRRFRASARGWSNVSLLFRARVRWRWSARIDKDQESGREAE